MKRFLYFVLLVALAYGSSVHQEHERRFGQERHDHSTAPIRRHSLETSLSHEIYGFVPYWEDSYSCPRYDLLSRIAYFNVSVNASGNITNSYNWYSASVIDDAIAAGVAVDLCVALFDNPSINTLISTPSYRGNCITNVINAMLARGGSGVNIDFEQPGGAYRDDLVDFMSEFRDSLNARAPGSWLSICLPAVDWGGAYDVERLAMYCDALFIMGYDYFWGGSSITGPVDPLDDPLTTRDIARSISDYAVTPLVRSKLILGLPLYGRQWSCDGPDRGASTISFDGSVFYRDAIVNAETHGRLWDTNSPSPWYRYNDGVWHQCWYSDSTSLAIRYEYAKAQGLLGVGWWALGYDAGDPAFWGGVELAFTGEPVVPDSSDSIIVDNSHGPPTFTHSAGWTEGSFAPEFGWEGNYIFCSATGDYRYAMWNPNLPYHASYHVYMWWYAGDNRCNNVPIEISGVETTDILVSQKGSGASWHYLGEYEFDAGALGYVQISNLGATDGTVIIADAVLWIVSEIMDVPSQRIETPDRMTITAYPNPFNSAVEISVRGFDGATSFAIYDINGKIADEFSIVENNSYTWRPDINTPSGIYHIKPRLSIEEDNSAMTTSVIYIK